MFRIVKFEMDGRGYSIENIAIVNQDDWEKLQAVCESGFAVYLGEVAGKHSEVEVTMEPGDFKVLSDDPNEVAIFRKLTGGSIGVNVIRRTLRQWDEQADDE